jgi:hypothetical protein
MAPKNMEAVKEEIIRLIVIAFSDFINKEKIKVARERPNQTMYKSLENSSDNRIPIIKTATNIGSISG